MVNSNIARIFGKNFLIINKDFAHKMDHEIGNPITFKKICTANDLGMLPGEQFLDAYMTSSCHSYFKSCDYYTSLKRIVGYNYIMFDIDTNKKTKDIKQLIKLADSIGMTVIDTGGGLHFILVLKYMIIKDSKQHKYVNNIISSIKNNCMYIDKAHNDLGGYIRIPGSWNMKYNKKVKILINNSDYKSDNVILHLKQFNNMLIRCNYSNINPLKRTRTVTIQSSRSRRHSDNYKNKPSSFDLIGIKPYKMPLLLNKNKNNQLLRHTNSMDYFIDDDKYLNSIIKKMFPIFKREYIEGNRYNFLISFISLLRQQGLQRTRLYIKIFKALEDLGIVFTIEHVSVVKYLLSDMIDNTIRKEYIKYKRDNVFIRLGIYISRFKTKIISNIRDAYISYNTYVAAVKKAVIQLTSSSLMYGLLPYSSVSEHLPFPDILL